MDNFTPERAPVNTELLPTPEVLADDLEGIFHALDEWESLPLLGLRLLPSVRFAQVDRRSPFARNGALDRLQQRSDALITTRIDEAIRRFASNAKRRALRALLAFDEPSLGKGERGEAAATHLGVPYETFRRGGVRKLLEELSSEMFRGELAWATYQAQPSPVSPVDWSVNAWCELLEVDRSVEIDAEDPRKQTWITRMLLRCLKHDIPFLVTGQRWTGSGADKDDETSKEPGVVTILPGTQETQPPTNRRLLLARPESEAQYAYILYLWDLGQARLVGEDFEHRWRQVLIDKKRTFVPYSGWATERFPRLGKLRLRVKLPPGANPTVYAKRLAVRDGMTATSYTARNAVSIGDPIPLDRDREGYYSYEPAEIIFGQMYELWWGDDHRP
jgi:hypothetical protein